MNPVHTRFYAQPRVGAAPEPPFLSMPVTEDDPAPLPSIEEFLAEMPAPAASASQPRFGAHAELNY